MVFPKVYYIVSTHSRPKAAGSCVGITANLQGVSTHSRPKAAGFASGWLALREGGFNSQPPEGGWLEDCSLKYGGSKFQLTAARRRLD